MTRMIYYDNPYQKTCSAVVAAVEQIKDRWALQFDRTIFYPEGGGQPADRGKVDGICLEDVRKQQAKILHIFSSLPPFTVGDKVYMELNWDHRYDYMQQHTGQHIISGVLHHEHKISTVSVHQGEEYTTIETDREEISEQQLFDTVMKSQQIIGSNIPVHHRVIQDGQDAVPDLRREPKVSGTIRVISLGEYDHAPCGGIHLKKTGEVLLVQCIGTEKIRGRIRTIWKIGNRAMEDYRRKDLITREAGSLLSAPVETIIPRLAGMTEEMKQLTYDKQQLQKQVSQYIVDDLFQKGVEIGGVTYAAAAIEADSPELMKHIGAAVSGRNRYIICVLGLIEQEIRWVISSDVDLPFTEIREKLFPLIDARGGGKHPLWQGIGKHPSGRQQFLQELRRWVSAGLQGGKWEYGKD